MSLGGTIPSQTLQRAIDAAWNKGKGIAYVPEAAPTSQNVCGVAPPEDGTDYLN